MAERLRVLRDRRLEAVAEVQAIRDAAEGERPLNEGALDLPLVEPTDEVIERQASRMVRERHREKIRKLDEEIAAFWPPW